MNVNHVAIWAKDIELLKEFYCRWFGAIAGERYHNLRKNFTSCFLTFPDGGARLEIMNVPEIMDRSGENKLRGLCHIAISLGSKEKVDEMTMGMRDEGITIIGEPRTTGDGYYESVIADPEGNVVELTI